MPSETAVWLVVRQQYEEGETAAVVVPIELSEQCPLRK